MSSRGAIETSAVVTAPGGVQAVQARLANGHTFVALVRRRERSALAALKPGDRVRVRFSPCDLSKAWMVVETEGKQ